MSKPQQKQNKQKKKAAKHSKSLATKVAETIGGGIGSLVGLKDLGRDAGSWLTKVTGLGDYKLHSNSFMKSSAGVPTFDFQPDGSVIVTHKEYVRDIVGSVDFGYRTYDICPTNLLLFQWLASIGMAFDQYEFLGLLACYVPISGDAVASTNNTLGSVIMATEYDVSRPVFQSKSEMEQYMFVTSSKPDKEQIHPIECNPNRDTLNARYMDSIYRTQAAAIDSTAGSVSTSDVERNLRCMGRLQIATQGMQAVVPVGELWLTFRVKLAKPRGVAPGAQGGFFHATGGFTKLTTGSTLFAGATVLSDSTFGANGVGIAPGNTTLTFNGLRPGSVVHIEYSAKYESGSGVTMTFGAITATGVSAFNDWYNTGAGSGSLNFNIDSANATTTNYCYNNTFQINDGADLTGAQVVYANPTIAGSSALISWDLKIFVRPRRFPGNTTYPTPLGLTQGEVLQNYMEYARQELRAAAAKAVRDEMLDDAKEMEIRSCQVMTSPILQNPLYRKF